MYRNDAVIRQFTRRHTVGLFDSVRERKERPTTGI